MAAAKRVDIKPRKAVLLLAAALTPIHPGAGRAPGSVDLPVVRDPQGLPHVRGSMLKGTLKSEIARTRNAYRKKDGAHVVNCSDAADICCLFGGEVGEGPEGASAIAILDLYPLAIPAPSYRIDGQNFPGIVYVTTASTLSLVSSYARVAGRSQLANNLSKAAKDAVEAVNRGAQGVALTGGNGKTRVLVGASTLELKLKEETLDIDSALGLGDLHPLYGTYPVSKRLIVLEDGVGRQVLEGLMDRRARVRLDRITKTVVTGGLWTEEYMPWGTLLAGLIISTGLENRFCTSLQKGGSEGIDDPLKKFKEVLNELGGLLVIGGKESIGAGLLKLKTLDP